MNVILVQVYAKEFAINEMYNLYLTAGIGDNTKVRSQCTL